MVYEILPSSPKALQESSNNVGRPKYPWELLEVGQSFKVPHGNVKLGSLRSQASTVGKQLNKQFRVVDHSEALCYEVALIKLTDPLVLSADGKAPWERKAGNEITSD